MTHQAQQALDVNFHRIPYHFPMEFTEDNQDHAVCKERSVTTPQDAWGWRTSVTNARRSYQWTVWLATPLRSSCDRSLTVPSSLLRSSPNCTLSYCSPPRRRCSTHPLCWSSWMNNWSGCPSWLISLKVKTQSISRSLWWVPRLLTPVFPLASLRWLRSSLILTSSLWWSQKSPNNCKFLDTVAEKALQEYHQKNWENEMWTLPL